MLGVRRLGGARPHCKGHRGAMAYAPENTMPSFEQAHRMGAQEIELDVQLTKDNHLVVMHDQMVDRTTNGSGYIRDLTWEQVQKLDAGMHLAPEFAGVRVPALNDVLEWARGKVSVAIEIKNGPHYYAGIEEKILACVTERKMQNCVLITSFDHPSLALMKEISLGMATGILFSCRPADVVELARQTGADVILPHWTFVTTDIVEHAHREGLGVNPWAVNSDDAVRLMLQMGVDTITSNYPDRARAIIDGKQPPDA